MQRGARFASKQGRTLAEPMTASAASCMVCGSTEKDLFARKGAHAFSKCVRCGFVFLDPRPSPEALAAQYEGDYREASETHYSKARSRMRRAMVKAARFFRYFRGREALDVGCGGGFMVEAMRRCGAARAMGLDISPQAIAYAAKQYPKNRYFGENIEAFRCREMAFDFVYSSEVIEHVPDVNAFMHGLSTSTRPGGFLYITTPDIGHWRVPEDVTSWGLFDPSQHIQFFDKGNMRILLERHGFEPRRFFFKIQPGLQVLARREQAEAPN